MKNRPHIIIGGYYGYKSIGDEAVLVSILTGIAKSFPSCRVTVLTSRGGDIPTVDGIHVRTVNRLDVFAIISAFILADVYISGGGSLLQDNTSSRSLSYYCALIRLARLCHTDVYVYANGIGPLKDSKKCKKVLRLAERISVRDPDSFKKAEKLCPDAPSLSLTADPVFAYPFQKDRRTFLACISILSGRPFFAVSLRECANKKSIDKAAAASAVKLIRDRLGLVPVFVSMENSFDLELCRAVAKETDGIVADVRDADELYCLLEKASLAVGMRLHFLLIAAIAGIPTVALSYDSKVDGCIRYLDRPFIADAFAFSPNEVMSLCQNALDSFDRRASEETLRRLRALAESDRDCLYDLLCKASGMHKAKEDHEKFFADS